MFNISNSERTPIDSRDFEFVERKGIGHPDTLTDGILEGISRKLSVEYVNTFGRILHHNVDKGLITGGATEVDFGGGAFTKPIQVTLSGRATSKVGSETIPVTEIAVESARSYLRGISGSLDEQNCLVESKISQGSRALVSLVEPKVPRSNDTSIAVGYAPYSVLEKVVLETERKLNSEEFKSKHPEVGKDIKIMGCRNGDRIELTIAAAFVSKHVKSLNDYLSKKERLRKNAERIAENIAGCDYEISVSVNNADKGNNVYLTLTGLSCEMGDDGSAGRGNRANGLICPTRLMTMESVAGKNPVSHVGKIYSVLAFRIAEDICELGAKECDVYLQSRIGNPINKPAAVSAEIIWGAEELKRNQQKIKKTISDRFDSIPELTLDFVRGKAFTL